MFVKICGITNLEDALAAVDAGARALGFIFYPPSPRNIAIEQLEGWVREIPLEILKVGVFVDEAPEAVASIASRAGLDIVQLHGSETPQRHPPGLHVWKAFRVNEAQTAVPDYPAADAILIDGKRFDWTRTAHFTKPLILAGGLDPENVQDRIGVAKRSGKLWGVDVASGVEAWPGRKDHARMKKFIEAANRS